MKNQKGITLIALVITIIVLLILAGVTIAMLTGENGILNKATTAVNNTTDAELKEAVRLAVATNITNNDGSFVVTDKTALKKEIETANANVTAEVTNIEEGENKGNYSVSVKPKNDSNRTPYTCIIDTKTGKITEPQ
ncbi:MAG TPA: prepilin-type N-terminal cleavage/methylation domain-containing protein [Clostridiaceae bacterium]|nr:prepilin-type N-terminal cleavage/methylation domain-containing protein [Clostridiaceae bacterium]